MDQNKRAYSQIASLRLVVMAMRSGAAHDPLTVLSELESAGVVDGDALLAASRRAAAWRMTVAPLAAGKLGSLADAVERAAEQIDRGAPPHEIDLTGGDDAPA